MENGHLDSANAPFDHVWIALSLKSRRRFPGQEILGAGQHRAESLLALAGRDTITGGVAFSQTALTICPPSADRA